MSRIIQDYQNATGNYIRYCEKIFDEKSFDEYRTNKDNAPLIENILNNHPDKIRMLLVIYLDIDFWIGHTNGMSESLVLEHFSVDELHNKIKLCDIMINCINENLYSFCDMNLKNGFEQIRILLQLILSMLNMNSTTDFESAKCNLSFFIYNTAFEFDLEKDDPNNLKYYIYYFIITSNITSSKHKLFYDYILNNIKTKGYFYKNFNKWIHNFFFDNQQLAINFQTDCVLSFINKYV